MRAPLALLLPLVVLALAHAAQDDLIWRRNKNIYERGNNRIPWEPLFDRHYYLANGQCIGVIEGNNIPCKALRLRVATGNDYLPPSIYISDKLDYVLIRRQKIPINRQLECPGRLDVYLNITCGFTDQ